MDVREKNGFDNQNSVDQFDKEGAVGPLARYREFVRKGILESDPIQLYVAEQLQLLSFRLQHYAPPVLGKIFSSLFGKSHKPPKGVYIFGGIGTGKTMLMDFFYETLQNKRKKRLHYQEFMKIVHAQITIFRKEEQGDPIPKVANWLMKDMVVLCLDEFQVQDITDAMIMVRLFDTLFERGLVLVTTSNVQPDQLYKNGLNRPLFLPFIDMLDNHVDLLELTTLKDYRIERLKQLKLWLTPLTDESAQQLENDWQAVTSLTTEKEKTIPLLSRSLTVTRAAGQACWFEFDELCAKPLGSADYLKLCDHFDVFFLSGIPKLKKEAFNEARRFVMLMDALYDQRKILFATAEAKPDELVTDDTVEILYARTRSRIAEMQSCTYLLDIPVISTLDLSSLVHGCEIQ